MSAHTSETESDMGDSKRRFFSGDTLQQALVQAANHFRLQPEEIAYHQIEKRHGFTKVRRKVVIEVDPAAPRQAQAAAAERSAAPVERAQAGRLPDQGERDTAAGAEPPASGAPPSAGLAPREPSGTPPRTRQAPRAPAPPHGRVPPEERMPSSSLLPAASAPDGRRGGGGGFDRGRPRRPSGAYPRDRRPGDHAGGGGGGNAAAERQDLVALPEQPRSVGERYPAAEGPQAEAAAKGVELLLRVAGLDLTPRIYQGEERLEIDLVGSDSDWCFADDGELLMAMEHLLPRIIRGIAGEAVLCRVDCDNFHEIREERLRSLAQKVADEVRQRGRSRTLVPMNPADRRIIHVTLADDPAVVTESEGEGYFKRITVRPA
jgi:predicted RNA-binding protein Jag